MNIHQQRNNKVVFLFGPTAVGKTDLLCSLFMSGYEVINADSVQVYRKLNIGSAKADSQTLSTVKHHLIDILDPWERFNVADFIRLADEACNDIYSNGNTPVISGGTAFYFKNFMFGLSNAPSANPKVRQEVSDYIENVGNSAAHEYLKTIDPVSAERINVNDTYRISRAIEVYKSCGKMLSSFPVPTTPRNNMNVLLIGLKRDKEDLRKRIEKRVDIMFEQGLEEEIKMLKEMGASLEWQSMQGIGYSEFFKYEDRGIDFIKNQIVMDSIHYAKRQMTFFNSFENVNWMNPDDTLGIKKLLSTFQHNLN